MLQIWRVFFINDVAVLLKSGLDGHGRIICCDRIARTFSLVLMACVRFSRSRPVLMKIELQSPDAYRVSLALDLGFLNLRQIDWMPSVVAAVRSSSSKFQ